MRYSRGVPAGVLTAVVLAVLALCGCEAKKEDGRRKEFVPVFTIQSLDSPSMDAVEILLSAENHVCSIYPDDVPELFVDHTLVHKVYWRAMGPHSFTFDLTPWPFSVPAAPISVPQGGKTRIYYVDSSFAGGEVSYNNLTYDNPPKSSCTSYIPDQNRMRIHITK
jgi:hypothetical protein